MRSFSASFPRCSLPEVSTKVLPQPAVLPPWSRKNVPRRTADSLHPTSQDRAQTPRRHLPQNVSPLPFRRRTDTPPEHIHPLPRIPPAQIPSIPCEWPAPAERMPPGSTQKPALHFSPSFFRQQFSSRFRFPIPSPLSLHLMVCARKKEPEQRRLLRSESDSVFF